MAVNYKRDDKAFRARMGTLADSRRIAPVPTTAFADSFAEHVHDAVTSHKTGIAILLMLLLIVGIQTALHLAAMAAVIVLPVALVAFVVRALVPVRK